MKRAFSARHILLKMGGRRFNKKAFKRLQNKVLIDLQKKHDAEKKSKDETLMDSILKLFNFIIFLKYKRKYKTVKRMSKKFRNKLIRFWFDDKSPTLEKRWKFVWRWIIYLEKNKYKINTKRLKELKPKYKLVCQDIEKRL